MFGRPTQVTVTLPIIIWQLAKDNAERHIVVWFIAGICVVIAVPLSIHDGACCWTSRLLTRVMARRRLAVTVVFVCTPAPLTAVIGHMFHYYKPDLQRYCIRIIFMVTCGWWLCVSGGWSLGENRAQLHHLCCVVAVVPGAHLCHRVVVRVKIPDVCAVLGDASGMVRAGATISL